MTKSKITHYRKITKEGKQIGKIQLVYHSKSEIPHLEYEIDDKYHSKGIMSKELKKYLSRLREKEIERFIAVVEKDNLASVKILKKNRFLLLYESEDYYYYVAAFDLWDKIEGVQKDFKKNIKTSLK